MSLQKREFLRLLGAASVAGMGLSQWAQADDRKASEALYDLPRKGRVSLLHMTDCHAQLLPLFFREPSVNLGVGGTANRLPHVVGEALLKQLGVAPGSRLAYAYAFPDFVTAARRYGRVGGFAHLRTLVKRLKDSRPGALLLDGGDTWQGSACSLWTQGEDMVRACEALGVDVMTGHWEFTYGADRVQELVKRLQGQGIDFVAQNVKTSDFGDAVFKPYVLREVQGVPCAIIGQAFPYTPIANPAYLVPDWTFGIQDQELQKVVDEVRSKGAQVVVLLSHNGMDVDLKLAGRVSGIDVILGGHTHDGMPVPVTVANAGGQTLVTNAGSNGKFLGVLDVDVDQGKVKHIDYHLLPVFADLLPPDQPMQSLIDELRRPFLQRLQEPLATTDGLLYRRGNFNGSWDQLIVDGLIEAQDAQIAFSPGFRWGSSLLPGATLTREDLMAQVATTYSYATVTPMTGATIKTVLEDVCDNLFNPDPYYQQGGDMVRVGGMTFSCEPGAGAGSRIQDMRLDGQLLEADKVYKVAGWAPVNQAAAQAGNKQVWEVLEPWLRHKGHIAAVKPAEPRLIGMAGNLGQA